MGKKPKLPARAASKLKPHKQTLCAQDTGSSCRSLRSDHQLCFEIKGIFAFFSIFFFFLNLTGKTQPAPAPYREDGEPHFGRLLVLLGEHHPAGAAAGERRQKMEKKKQNHHKTHIKMVK